MKWNKKTFYFETGKFSGKEHSKITGLSAANAVVEHKLSIFVIGKSKIFSVLKTLKSVSFRLYQNCPLKN